MPSHPSSAPLPILLLPPNSILFPSLSISSSHPALLQLLSLNNNRSLLVGCCPTADHESPHLPHRWGCLATALPPQDSKSIVLRGSARLRVDRFLSQPHNAPLPLALVSLFHDIPLSPQPSHPAPSPALLIPHFAQQALRLANVLSPSHSAHASQFALLVQALSPLNISRFIDMLLSSLSIVNWHDRLLFLELYQVHLKLKSAIALLHYLNTALRLSPIQPSSPSLPPFLSSLHAPSDQSSANLIHLLASNQNLSQSQKAHLILLRLHAIRKDLQAVDHVSSHHHPLPSDSHSPQNTLPSITILGPNSAPLATSRLPRGLVLNVPRAQALGRLPISPANGPEEDEFNVLEKSLRSAGMTREALEMCLKEIKRLRSIPVTSVEHSVIRNYLEIMLEIPWSKKSAVVSEGVHALDHRGFLKRARQFLDQDHYGMNQVKRRLIEFLAVIRLGHDLEQEQADGDGHTGHDSLGVKGSSDCAVTDEDIISRTLGTPLAVEKTEKDVSVGPRARPIVKKSPILLLVGPPGVGKTSIIKSIARALNRKFYRISLGGIKDESEIRGHRRTYVGSMPGRIVQGLRRVGVNDPVMLLDEIDKAGGKSINGDPSAALLEVLDPEQNQSFVDHYINTPIDLSSITFIGTANSTSSIGNALLDRMEVIELGGYVLDEKLMIAKRNLIPKVIRNLNLSRPAPSSAQEAASTPATHDVVRSPMKKQRDMLEYIGFQDDAVLVKLISGWTHEAGVRTLEKQIESVFRFKLVEALSCQPIDQQVQQPKKAIDPKIRVEDLGRILGPEKYEPEKLGGKLRPGVVIGMAYQAIGTGTILFIESSLFKGKGHLRLTGSLGSVMKESIEIGLSWIRSHAYELNLSSNAELNGFVDGKMDLHVHFPEGGIKKDGPSAGVGLVICLVGLFSKLPVESDLAVTGEISLRGQVLGVGGIREKVMAAHRAGIRRIILPQKNAAEMENLFSLDHSSTFSSSSGLRNGSEETKEGWKNEEDEGDGWKRRLREEMKVEYVGNLFELVKLVFRDRLWKAGQVPATGLASASTLGQASASASGSAQGGAQDAGDGGGMSSSHCHLVGDHVCCGNANMDVPPKDRCQQEQLPHEHTQELFLHPDFGAHPIGRRAHKADDDCGGSGERSDVVTRYEMFGKMEGWMECKV